jgi:hypothetical protein
VARVARFLIPSARTPRRDTRVLVLMDDFLGPRLALNRDESKNLRETGVSRREIRVIGIFQRATHATPARPGASSDSNLFLDPGLRRGDGQGQVVYVSAFPN